MLIFEVCSAIGSGAQAVTIRVAGDERQVAGGPACDVDELVVLMIDLLLVPSEVVWEPPAPDADELFPHIYGPLSIAAVNTTDFWTRGPTGWHLHD